MIYSFGEFRLSYRTGDIVSPRVDAAEPLSLELADLCACIRLGGDPRSSSTLGLDVLRVVVAAERSLRGGGVRTPVEVAGASLGHV